MEGRQRMHAGTRAQSGGRSLNVCCPCARPLSRRHLIKGTPVPRPAVIDPKSDHLSFQADCLDGVQAALQSRGITYVRQQVVEGGIRVEQLFILDPDHNMIEASRRPAAASAAERAALGCCWAGCCWELAAAGVPRGLLPILACSPSPSFLPPCPALPRSLPRKQVCNCDCLPIIPLDNSAPLCVACAGSPQQARQAHSEDEAMSELASRDSLDSNYSEQGVACHRSL